MDTFYRVRDLPFRQQAQLLRRAFRLRENWWFDVLDCSVSFARQVVPDISFSDAMKHFSPGSLLSVIHRRPPTQEEPHLEVGFRAMTTPDYFLWIVVPLERADAITKGLETLN
jgi:hypothetical protein